MHVFEHPEYDRHERVLFANDQASGLCAVLAIHRMTRFGGAGGGCRIWPYPGEAEALTDALRLSRAMSYKLALAGVPQGGAKMVVLGDPLCCKSGELLHAIGALVEELGGRYVAGGDVGVDDADLEVIRQATRFVVQSGGASEATAEGVVVALRAAVARRLGRDELRGLRVTVQGLGTVGRGLCRRLVDAGARLVVCDVRADRVDLALSTLPVEVVDPDAVYDVDAEVFAPCALGAVLDDTTIPRLRCSVVVGAANNQLAEPRHADALGARGVCWIPDFVASSGGALTVGRRARGERIEPAHVARLAVTVGAVLDRAEADGVSTLVAAERLARERAPHLFL